MKVGILTFHFCHNYGALLQCISLYRAVKALGHEVDVIDFHPVAEKELKLWEGWCLRQGLNSRNLRRRWSEIRYSGTMKSRFDSMAEQELSFSPSCNREQVNDVVQDYEALIVGSDQVWNRAYYYAPPAYFLDFEGAYKGRRISYAACSGNGVIPEGDDLDLVSSALQQFDSVAVRNNITSDWYRSMTAKEAAIVCDPTLLTDLSDLELPTPVPEAGYILMYILGNELHGGHIAALKEIRKTHGNLPAVWICPTAHRPDSLWADADITIYDAGPGEWMYLFRNAAFVYTDSFHGAVFSSKFRRPFMVYYAEEMRSHRLKDLAARYGVSGAVVSSLEDAVNRGVISGSLDFDAVHQLIDSHRTFSAEWLESALSE